MTPHRFSSGKKAWDLFLDKGQFDPRLVRAEVASSWQRCQRLKLNPQQAVDSGLDAARLLDERRYHKELLCRIARPLMRDLYYFVSGSDFQVILTDEEGYLLDVLGDDRIISRTKRVSLCPGANWSEASKGTNAIGTAIVERQPVQIYAWEHYCEGNHFLTCSAAPIQNTEGSVIGVLDVSGDCRQANPHTLGMVVATVRAIENQLRLETATTKLQAASRYSNAISQSVSDGLLAIDCNGIVTDINPRAGVILGVIPERAKGRHLDLICGQVPILRVLENGLDYQNQEVVLPHAGKRISSSGSALRDDGGGIVGAVAFFRELSNHAPVVQRAGRQDPCQSRRYEFDDIVGDSPVMTAAKDWARLAARSASTVLILGESGTGKELFASAVHHASQRSSSPFVAINCAALPETLIESELFGYMDGSFTGAKKGGQPGKFEIASGGTVFLDEIGDMSLIVQAKLLRVIQERKVARLGSAQEIPVDIRIIAATHKDLKHEVERGAFREDLYYRLTVLEITVPPLRERVTDIPALARCLVARITAKLNKGPIRIEDEFLTKLCSHHWPGNVREMENLIEGAIVRIGDGDVLVADSLRLPGESKSSLPGPPVTKTHGYSSPAAIRPLRDVEKQAIAEALSSCGGNIVRTAERLGIARNTLYRKMEEYDLVPADTQRRMKKEQETL